MLGCVCAGVGAPLVPSHSWLGCAVWVCLFGLGFRLRPATPGWGVGVCVLVSVLPLYPATPGWGVRCGCVCLGPGLGCASPVLAGVLGLVCVGVPAPLVPCHSWLGCAVSVCVFGLGFRLRPATPCWGVGVCVCLCACSACTLPLLAGVCGVGVCAWAGVLAAPRHPWLGCWGACVLVSLFRLYPATPGCDVRRGCVCFGWGFGCAPPLLAGVLGCVCAGVCAPPVPCQSCLGFVLWSCVLGLRFLLRPATPGCGVWCVGWLLPGTCSCAVVVAGGVPLWRASWPRDGAPRLVLSGRSRCSGWLSRRRGAFPHPGGLRPRFYWVAARGTGRPAKNRAHCACCWPPPRQGRWARSAFYPFSAQRWGCSWRVPPPSVLGCVRCGVWRVWTRSLTRPVSHTACLSMGDSAGAPWLFYVDADTASFGSKDATPGSRVCVRVRAFFAVLRGPASRARFGVPHLFLSPFLLLSLSARALRAGVALLVLFLGLPPLLCATLVPGVLCFPARGALGLGVLWSSPPLIFVFFSFPPPCVFVCPFCFLFPGLFFFLSSLPPVLALRCRAGVSWSVGRVRVCCCGPCASAGAAVCLRSVVRCTLPVPPCFVMPVVLCVPVGAVLAALLFPLPPCGVVLGRLVRWFFFASGLRWLRPPPLGGWLRCRVLWFVVRRVVWCVLCCVRCCVACLSFCAVLCWVVLCCCCCALFSCVAAFSAGFFFALFLAFPWCSGLCLFPCSACAVLCWCACVVALCALLSCLVFCVVVCRVCMLAVGPGCPLLSPGGSWWLLPSCFGGVLWCVPGCRAAPCCFPLCRPALCGFVLLCSVLSCGVSCRSLSSWGPVLSGAAFCRVSSRCVCFAVVCRCVVLFAAVLCAVCVPGSRAVRYLSSPPCAVLLWGPALPWCPAPLCCALSCCAAVWWRAVPSSCFVWFVSCLCLVSTT